MRKTQPARMSVSTNGSYHDQRRYGRPVIAARMSVHTCGPCRPARKLKRSHRWSPKARKTIHSIGGASTNGETTRKKPVSRSTKAGLHFPVARIARFLMTGKHATSIGPSAPVYLAAVLEHLTAVVLTLAKNAALSNEKKRIGPDEIHLAVHNHEELRKLLGPVLEAVSEEI